MTVWKLAGVSATICTIQSLTAGAELAVAFQVPAVAAVRSSVRLDQPLPPEILVIPAATSVTYPVPLPLAV